MQFFPTSGLSERYRAQLRWDFITAENSMGFHSPQETMKTLANAIDYARQSQLVAEMVMKTIAAN